MNPNGLNVSHLNQFTDAGPLQEGCDLATCTDRVGGDHSDKCRIPVDYVSFGPCSFCKRDTDSTSVNVVMSDGSIGVCCGICYEKADEPDSWLDERLDYDA